MVSVSGYIEVFSPAIRTSSKGAVGAAGQGQRPVVGDFDHGYSVRVPARGTWHLRGHMRLTCSDALSGGPCTAYPGEKTSIVFVRRRRSVNSPNATHLR